MTRKAASGRTREGGSPAPPGFRFFGGKGGAGKTTCSAAFALSRAEAGRSVLAVSTDPAHSLGDALGFGLDRRPRPVPIDASRGGEPAGRSARAGGAASRRRLFAVELDADRALERWMAERRPLLGTIAERGTYLDQEDVSRFLGLSLPGVDELIGLVELSRLSREGTYDEVVVDTAPTGHTLRLLAMPETLRRIAVVLDHMHAKHRFLARSLGGGYRPDDADALIEEIDAEGRSLGELLRDPRRASFSWVLLPEAMSLEEARDGIRELEEAGIAVGEVVVNRITPPPGGPCALCEGRRRAERAVIEEARARFPGRTLRLIPALPREPRGAAALREVGRRLLSRSGRSVAAGVGQGRPPRWLSASWRKVPDRRREWLSLVAPPQASLLMFGGKGGVGKTTCAAAAALALSERDPDRKVLLLSADPAHSLADVLQVPLGDDERPLPGGPPRLRARELDAEAAFRTRRERYREAVDQLFRSLRRGSSLDPAYDRAVVQDLIELTPPGLDELFAVLSVTAALFAPRGRRPRYDAVVVDTAPTGHTLRLLDLPAAALEWVRAFMSILLKYREVIGLGELAQDLVATSRDLRKLQSLLHDPRKTRFAVVSRAAALPRLETIRMLGRLKELGIAVSALIVDAVTPPGCARCRRAAAAEAVEIEALERGCRALTRRKCPMILAPALAPPPRGIGPLGRWGRLWKPRGA